MIHVLAAMKGIKEANERLELTRRCPKCRKKQVVDKSEKAQTVDCQKCGAPLSPESSDKAQAEQRQAKD